RGSRAGNRVAAIDEHDPRTGGRSDTTHDVVARHLCWSRVTIGQYRNLRRRRLYSGAAHRRNWSARGPWRANPRCPSPGPESGNEASIDGPRDRTRRNLRPRAIDCSTTLPGFSAQSGAPRWRSCLTYGHRTNGLPFARASRRARRSGASIALGINGTPLYADSLARARNVYLCRSLLPDCYVILVVVAVNQFIAIEPDERPKVSVEETIAFDRDQRDGETRCRIV